MTLSRTVIAIWILWLGNWAGTGMALAQTFEERWSPIPKAHAGESASPQSNSQRPDEPAASQPQAVEAPRAELPKATSRPSPRARKAVRHVFTGKASYYTYHGGKTASGQPFSPNALTAAHRSLPFGTRVRVTDIQTNKTVEVVITDRGPVARARVLDLSLGAAKALDIGRRGVIKIRAEIIS